MAENLVYGGQAVIEGVMMRSPRFYAVACRRPDGEVVLHEEPVGATLLGRIAWLNRPFLRGTLAILDALTLGMKALAYAANVQAAAEAEAAAAVRRAAGKEPAKGAAKDLAIGLTLALSLALGVALFVALPTLLTQLVQDRLGAGSSIARNLLDGGIRLGIFLVYLLAISQMSNIRRVFQYHGAEHKAINAFESGRELTLANALEESRIHPRCGTSFVVIVLLATILVHSVFPRPEHALIRVGLHLALVPLVAGSAYELIRLAGRARNQTALRWMLAPGLWSQRLTTREPDSDQVEVALAALVNVVEKERAETLSPS